MGHTLLGGTLMARRTIALLSIAALLGCSESPVEPVALPDVRPVSNNTVGPYDRLAEEHRQLQQERDALADQVDQLQQQLDALSTMSIPVVGINSGINTGQVLPSEQEAKLLQAIATLERKHNEAFDDVMRAVNANSQKSVQELGPRYPYEVAQYIQGSRLVYENLCLLFTCVYLKNEAKRCGSSEVVSEIDSILALNAKRLAASGRSWSALTVGEGMMGKLVRETESRAIAAAAKDEVDCARELKKLWLAAASPAP